MWNKWVCKTMNTLLEQIQFEYNRYYQFKMRKPNFLLLSTIGRMQLQYENNNIFCGWNEIKSGSHIFDSEVLIVDENDLDGNMFKWIYVERND